MKLRIFAWVLCLLLLSQMLMGCVSQPEDPAEDPKPSAPTSDDETNDTVQDDTPEEDKPTVPETVFHTVTFDLDGGYTTPAEPQTVRSGARAEKPEDPKRAGHLFAGWACDGEAWNFATDRVDADTTLTATWTAIPYSEGLAYTLLENGTYSVSIGEEINSTWIHVPPTHEGIAVTEVASYGFAGAKNLLSAIIPNSVTHIGQYAFSGCDNIQSLTVPFVGNNQNTRLSMLFGMPGDTPYSLKNLVVTGNYPLGFLGICYNSAVTSVAILEGTYLGEGTFCECFYLTEVYLPATLERIDEKAFDNCQSLTELTLPACLTRIGERAFLACNSLRKIHFKGTVAQWEAIEKGTDWNRYVENCRVYCADGTIDL